MQKISQILAEVPKTESGAIDLTRATRIAEGGTHLLYRFQDAPYVIKVMKQNPKPEELVALEKKYTVLYACFDQNEKQRCIREQHITHPVLLPGKDIQETALSIVPYEKAFQAKVKFDFKIEPAELDPFVIESNPLVYDKANQTLIYASTPMVGFDVDDYGLIDERVGAILKRLDSDAKLKAVVIEFLNHYPKKSS